MGISGVRKLGYNDINDEMMSQASCPTDLDTTFNSFGQAPPRREVFNSNSGFESLDPVYEEPDSVDQDEVLLNVSPNKFEKPKD